MNVSYIFPPDQQENEKSGEHVISTPFTPPIPDARPVSPVKVLRIDIPQTVENIQKPKDVSLTNTLPLVESSDNTSEPEVSIPALHISSDEYVHVHSIEPELCFNINSTSNPNGCTSEIKNQISTGWKSSSEYALHILFTKFVRHAETKLNLCLQHPLDLEPPIIDILGENADPEFDKIIRSLGYISRRNPKPVIDAMMFWRKTKSEVAVIAAESINMLIHEYDHYQRNLESSPNYPNISTETSSHSKSLSSSNKSSHKMSNSWKSYTGFNNFLEPKLYDLEQKIEIAKETALQADRKSLISIFILCRVLIEMVKQSSKDIDDDLTEKLEEIVFTQLKTTDPISISSSLIKSSNWRSFAKLLGCMAENKFVSVSDRFIADLEKMPIPFPQEMEPSIHLLILGMQYLKLKNYPLECFEESAEFILSVAKFFSKSPSFSLKVAYAEVLSELLLPLADSVTAEVNHPTWVEALKLILSSCSRFQTDSKFWSSSFKLTVSVLCVAPHEIFTQVWGSLMEKNIIKIKSKSIDEKIFFALGLSRSIWVYLFRCTETLNNTERTLKKFVSILLSTKKKDNWITLNMDLINPLCDVLVTVYYQHPVFVLEMILLPLIKNSFNGSNLDNLCCEKLIWAVNTYKGMLLTNTRPNFPEKDYRYYKLDLNNIEVPRSENILAAHEEICNYFNKLFLLLDSSIGSEVWSPENEHQRHPSTPFSNISQFTFSFSNDNNNTNSKVPQMILFATLIETISCCLSTSNNIPFKSTMEILSRNAVHGDKLVAISAQNSLKALASKKNPYTLITWFAKYSFDFDERSQSRYNLAYLSSLEYRRLLVLYVELLEHWLDSFKLSSEERPKDLDADILHLPSKDQEFRELKEGEKLEWKNVMTVIEDVEGNGLFFLSSYDPSVRQLAIQILRIISKFDEAMTQKTSSLEKSHSRSSSLFAAKSGTRLIDLLHNCDFLKLVDIDSIEMSVAEKSRLSKLTSRMKHGVLLKLAESEYGVDAALWYKVFPKFLSVICESCPVTMALCRSIVCIRLVRLHETILSISGNKQDRYKDISPEVIVEQWKLYLVVACTSLTSTNDQKLHIPSTITHGRKKSQQSFTVQYQKIKSATSVFKMVLPLLNSEQTMIKDAIITGMSSMNINIFPAYIENVETFLTNWRIDNDKNMIRIEIIHILVILSPFFRENSVLNDEWILKKLSLFLRETKKFLEITDVQTSFKYQKLRRYFAGCLSSYYSAVKSHPLIDLLFPFEARASCFNYLKTWCGYGQYASLCKERYSEMLKDSQNSREFTTLATAIEFERSRFEIVALNSMIILCSSNITKVINDDVQIPIQISFDISGLLCWIDSMLTSGNEKITALGVCALKTVLSNNVDNLKLYKHVLAQCTLKNDVWSSPIHYFSTLCSCILEVDTLILPEDDLISLGLYGIVHDKKKVRASGIDVLSAIELKIGNSSYVKGFKERLFNDSKTVYKSTAKEISTIFAEIPSSDMRLKLFSRMTYKFEILPSELKQDYLVMLVPWVNKFVLKSLDDLDTFMVLSNIFSLTIHCNNMYPMEIEQLWISLGKGNAFQNIHVALDYIITMSLDYRNPNFVIKAKEVVLYLANVPGGMSVLDTLMKNLETKNMVPSLKTSLVEPINDGKYVNVPNIWNILEYTDKEVIFSKAQLSLIFLVNLLSIPNNTIKKRLHLLLHISISLLDHYIPIIQESAAKILCGIIFCLAPTHEKSEETVNLIKNKLELWTYDTSLKDKNSIRSPKNMDLLIKNIITIFSTFDTLQSGWERTALKWATTCPMRHVACRSFQIFRSLLTCLDQDMLRDILHRLSNTISDENIGIQDFSMQILIALNSITEKLDAEKLIDFPQLFWSMVACLSSVHEQEFTEVLSTLSKFVSKIDLDSPDTVQCLIATFPSNWEGKFDGLQQIVITGLRSSDSWDLSLKFLDRLNLLQASRIIANSDSRLLFALLANLPRFLHAMDTKEFEGEISTASNSLILLSNTNGHISLSRLIDSLIKNKFRSKKDFVGQIVTFISRVYFPLYSFQTLVFLLGLLFNKISWVKTQTMEILKVIFPIIDLTRPEFVGVGADLLSPLLRLLLTEYEIQALEVLDCVKHVSGSRIDKDVLRISMCNKEDRKFYSKASMFGIPDDNGWSISNPSIAASTTRHNIHAVFLTCNTNITSDNLDEHAKQLNEVVQFHTDDHSPISIKNCDSISVVEEKDGSLSHMWAELDNLDSFFTKELTVPESDLESQYTNHTPYNSIDTTHMDNDFESAQQLYDKKVSVILNKSLNRTSSNISFKTNLADSFGNYTNSGIFTLDNSMNNYIRSLPYTPDSNRNDMASIRSPSRSLLNTVPSSINKMSDNQESLFRFEDLLRNPHRSKKKHQLLSPVVHEQSSCQNIQENYNNSPPIGNLSINHNSASSLHSPIQSSFNPKDGNKTKNNKSQLNIKGKSQKHHYHLPHFSSKVHTHETSIKLTASPSNNILTTPTLSSSANVRFGSRQNTPINGFEDETTPVQKLMKDHNPEDDLMVEKQLLYLQDQLQNISNDKGYYNSDIGI